MIVSKDSQDKVTKECQPRMDLAAAIVQRRMAYAVEIVSARIHDNAPRESPEMVQFVYKAIEAEENDIHAD